ncbi:hypothetical protein [Streptomyces sp. cf386]|uniref:hypothetical protein n=1 Tax=Streptomyces sp. cf386 TaxID=1761904 RepID=UPI00115F8422|nr:hypothetical protein [Streptomyces sp. cf386]
MTDDSRVSPSAPPAPRSKRRNAVLALYDSPVHRDWAFWMTVGWGLLTAVSIPSGDQPTELPVWLDTLLAVLTFVILFGVFPTWLRLLVRRWLARRRDRSPHSFAGAPPGAADRAAAPSARRPTAPPVTTPPQPRTEPARRRPPPPRTQSPHQQREASEPQRVQQSVPLAKDDTKPPSTSAVWVDARNKMPHPVARALRTLQQANTSKEQYEALLDAAEILAISVSVTAAALLRGKSGGSEGSEESGRRNLSTLRSALLAGGGATFGTWTNWLEALRPFAASHPDVVPGLPNALRGDLHTTGLVDHLNALRTERNRAAHGDRPQSAGESTVRVAEIRPHLEQALIKAEFLTRLPWLLTVSCSYRPRSDTFDVVAHHVMGDHPDFERREFTWPDPVANDVFYVLSAEGPVTLSPFVASLFCPQCRQMEVCYSARAAKNTGPATLKSFARGHTVHSPDLGDEIRSLPDHRQGTAP